MKKRAKIVCIIILALALAQPLSFATASFSDGIIPAMTAYAEDDTEQPPEEDPADTAALAAAIQNAEAYKTTIRPSTDGADVAQDKIWAPQSAFNALNASINAAKETLANTHATQNEVNAQASAVDAALAKFKDACSYGTKSNETEQVREVVKEIFLKMDEPGADGRTHFVGEDFDSAYKAISITEKGKTLQLNGWFTTNKSDGQLYESANAQSPLGVIALQWSSSNMEVATVSPSGRITALTDGDVTITVRVAEESHYEGSNAPAKSVTLRISGQTAEYVTSVKIIDEKGSSLSKNDDDGIVIKGKNEFFQFHAKVVWHDPRAGVDRTEDTRTGSISSEIKWSVGGSASVASINEATGRLKTAEYSGNCFVQCSVTGGNGGVVVTDVAPVAVDTGEYEYKPAGDLTLSVVYQQFPNETVQTHTYPLGELAAKLPASTNSYSVLGSSRYGVIRATGYLFKDVVALEGISIDDVYQFRFTTADGYDNPLTAQMLYGSGARYYFPNWDIGSRAGAQVVPPMLAFQSTMMWGESMVNPAAPLDEGTRFRLVFGPLWGGESNSAYQIYYIKAITIVLKGAPPAESAGGGKNKGGGGTDEGIASSKGKDGGAKGGGEGFGSGGAGSGSGNGGASGNLGVGNLGGGGTAESSTGGKLEGGTETGTVGNGIMPSAAGGTYKVYEMISNSKSAVMPLNVELPWMPIAAPLAGGCVILGGLTFFIGFRRRLR